MLKRKNKRTKKSILRLRIKKENIQVPYKYKKTAKNILLDKTTSENRTNLRNSGSASYVSSKGSKSLPKTNDLVNLFFNLAGMMLLLVSLTLRYLDKKKDQSKNILQIEAGATGTSVLF